MNAIENLTQINYLLVILGFFAILFAIKEIIEIISYFKKKFRIKTGSEEDKETLEERISTLEEHDKWQSEEIAKISDNVLAIKNQLDNHEKENNERIIVQYSATLYDLHDKFIKQGYVTRAGMETFERMAYTYIGCGGNHLIKQKIIPEVLALPIKDE